MSDSPDNSQWEPTRRWIATLVAVVGLASGFLSWFSSYVMQGARISTLETAFTAHVVEYQKGQDKRDVQMEALSSRVNAQERDSDKRLTRVEDGVSELKGMLQHLDGRLSGSAVVNAKERR